VIKALSIRQPWAWAIIHAGKDIENRSWATSYRGPVLIHAAKGMTRREYENFLDVLRDSSPLTCAINVAGGLPAYKDLLRGGIVGKAHIVDCVGRHSSPWFFGRFGFVLADMEPMPFTPLRGALGFFEVPAALLDSPEHNAVPEVRR
jgi:hypothetical protein